MTESTISAATWLAGETFMQDKLSLIVMGSGFAFFALVFMLLYHYKQRKVWVASGIIVVSLLLLGLYTGAKVNTYATYAKLAKSESPRIRDRQKKPFTYHDNDKEKALLIDIDKLDALPFYQRTDVVEQEKVAYLGKTDHLYYFQLKSTLYSISVNSPHIVFSPEITAPAYVGYLYTLTDAEFSELGFYEEIGPIFYELQIPTSEAEKPYEDLDKVSEVLIF